MNKKFIVTISAVVVLFILGIGVYQSDASEGSQQLTIEEVSDLVSNQYPGMITEIELDKSKGKFKYEVEIENGNLKYDLDIDAHTGEILKIKEKTTRKPETMTLDENKREKNKEQTKQAKKQDASTMIDAKQAIDIALNEYSGIVTELELEKEDGRLIYEIEIKDGKEEAEIEIDAYTGEVLVIEIEND